MIDQFSDEALTQLRTVIREEVRSVVRPIIQDEVRTIVREEVRSEVAIQLKPVNEKLDRLVETEREDTDSLNSVVMQNVDDIKLIKKHVGLPVAA